MAYTREPLVTEVESIISKGHTQFYYVWERRRMDLSLERVLTTIWVTKDSCLRGTLLNNINWTNQRLRDETLDSSIKNKRVGNGTGVCGFGSDASLGEQKLFTNYWLAYAYLLRLEDKRGHND